MISSVAGKALPVPSGPLHQKINRVTPHTLSGAQDETLCGVVDTETFRFRYRENRRDVDCPACLVCLDALDESALIGWLRLRRGLGVGHVTYDLSYRFSVWAPPGDVVVCGDCFAPLRFATSGVTSMPTRIGICDGCCPF